jgi:homoaconitate hydratase family protein
MSQTIAEKILSSHNTKKKKVYANDFVEASIDCAMSHDNTVLISSIFKKMSSKKVWDSKKIVIVLDHRTPANTEKTAINHKYIREFVKQQTIPHFFDVGKGICHQILPEEGFVRPGMLIVGSDSHTTTYGAFGAFATGIGATDMANVWTKGSLWFKVPESIRFNIKGKLPNHVSAKDLILYIIGFVKSDGAEYKSCEFYGKTIKEMSIESRLCICNQAMEMGAKTAIMPPDEKTIQYIKSKTSQPLNVVPSDKNAVYEKNYDIDISNLQSQISCPDTVDNVKTVHEIRGLPIHQAVLGSCTNGRIEDLKIAASFLKGKTIAKHVRMLIIPSSITIYNEAAKKGYIQTLTKAGGTILNPGCGPCLGLHQGVVAEDEIVISTTNRNFKGRMGSSKAKIYLASPATVAASAIRGEITNPQEII